MDTEELSQSSSFIPICALREAADIKQSIKQSIHRKSASEILKTDLKTKSLSAEVTKIININPKIIHQRYNTTHLENANSHLPSEYDHSEIEKKYLITISKLNQEIFILSQQLKQANSVIASLSNKLNENINKHAVHLQVLQERHEQKIQKCQQEFEIFLMSAKKSKKNEINSMRENFEKEIFQKDQENEKNFLNLEKFFLQEMENLKIEYNQQLNSQKQRFVDIIQKIKNRFIEEIEFIQKKYKKKFVDLEKNERNSTNYEKDFEEDEGSTVIETDLKNKEILDEEVLNEYKKKTYSIEYGKTKDFETSIMNLLSQLK